MKKELGYFLLIVLSLLSTQITNAAININLISTTVSSCGNNGTATVHATSSKSPSTLFYEIIAGPTTAPLQNNATFSSLFPGTYTVRVYDIDFVSKDEQFTITGNYQLPSFSPTAIHPTCSGFTDGAIIGNADITKGKAPFTWEMTSPASTPAQSSDKFNNLSSGSYVIRMTDACGNYQTRTAILANGTTGLSHGYDGIPSVVKIGCDSFQYTIDVRLFKEKAKYPLKITINTTSGTKTKYVYPIARDTTYSVPGLYQVIDTVTGVDYGSFLSACLTDTCGYSICSSRNTISPFEFNLDYKVGMGCGNKMSANVYQKNPPYYPQYMYTSFRKPAKLTLTDVATNIIVDSMTCFAEYCQFQIKEQVSGRTYHLRIVDGCGKVFQQTIVWPVPAAPRVETYPTVGCLDSTGGVAFAPYNFKSLVKLEILSGPKYVGSTKPGYVFSDSITYPQIFTGVNFSLKNLAAGTYQYRVSDSCGNVVNGSFVLSPLSLANFNYSYSVKKGCIGDNILHFNPLVGDHPVALQIRDVATGAVLYTRHGGVTKDSLMSLPPGKYELRIYYGHYYGGGMVYNGYLTNGHSDCWAVYDTITIPPYSNNTFKSNTTISCNGNSYVQLNVDSTSGVSPYQYEIISGAQTYPLQNSNVFSLSAYGDYVIRIRDACGNTNTRQISIDSAKFPPVIRKGVLCRGNKIVLSGISSSFFTYEWLKPDGTVFKGDSLVIHFLSAADTGLYTITKKVEINGCTDVFRTTYHVGLNDGSEQTIPFCNGTSIQIGTHIYTLPGIYKDTLTNELGCDSIVVTKLIALPQKIDTNHVAICKGEHIIIGNTTYTLPGTYKDSTQNAAGCYDILITELKVNGIPDTIHKTICSGEHVRIGNNSYKEQGVYTDTLMSSLGCDSILVLQLSVAPLKEYVLEKTICEGESFSFINYTYSETGVYRDTVAASPCKSIIVLKLDVIPKNYSLTKSVCPGEGFTVGAHTYHQTGIYRDTLLNTAGCDSIIILNLTVYPYKKMLLEKSVCMGESFTMGNKTYYQPGVYSDTLSTATCDSIVTLKLTIQPYKTAKVERTICMGGSTSIGASTYTQAGIYIDTLSTTTCDSIVTLKLTIAPPPVFNSSFNHCFEDGNLYIHANAGHHFLWPTLQDTTATIMVNKTGLFYLTIINDKGCSGPGQVVINERCEPSIYVPSAFSPNGDGLHDDLEIFGKNFSHFELKIFNRWGEIIFISTDRDMRWNGLYREELMPVGSYPWVITYQSNYGADEIHTLKGSVTLIR